MNLPRHCENVRAVYIRNAKIIFVIAPTHGFGALREVSEEVGQLEEPSFMNAFVRSVSTLRKVVLGGIPEQLPRTCFVQTSERGRSRLLGKYDGAHGRNRTTGDQT